MSEGFVKEHFFVVTFLTWMCFYRCLRNLKHILPVNGEMIGSHRFSS